MSRGQASEKLRNKQDWGVVPHRGVIMGFTPWLHEVPLGSLMKFRMLHGVSHLPWGDPSSMSISAPVLPWEAQLLVCAHHHPGQHLLPSKPSCSWLSSLEWSRAQFWKVYHLIYTQPMFPSSYLVHRLIALHADFVVQWLLYSPLHLDFLSELCKRLYIAGSPGHFSNVLLQLKMIHTCWRIFQPVNISLGLWTPIPSLNCCCASCDPVCKWAGEASVLVRLGRRWWTEETWSSWQVYRTGGWHISNHRIHENSIEFVHLVSSHLIFVQYLSNAFCVSGFVRGAVDSTG